MRLSLILFFSFLFMPNLCPAKAVCFATFAELNQLIKNNTLPKNFPKTFPAYFGTSDNTTFLGNPITVVFKIFEYQNHIAIEGGYLKEKLDKKNRPIKEASVFSYDKNFAHEICWEPDSCGILSFKCDKILAKETGKLVIKTKIGDEEKTHNLQIKKEGQIALWGVEAKPTSKKSYEDTLCLRYHGRFCLKNNARAPPQNLNQTGGSK